MLIKVWAHNSIAFDNVAKKIVSFYGKSVLAISKKEI